MEHEENILQSIQLIDTFSVDEKTYLKMRRRELRQHAESHNSNMLLFNSIDTLYPYTKRIMEYVWGLPK